MQPLAFLWFEMQMTQQYLRERTFGPAQHSADQNSRTRKRTKCLLMIAACLLIAAFVHQVRSSQFMNYPANAPATPQAPVEVYPEKGGVGQTVAKETVSVIHPEKSQAATLQSPGQLSAYTDAPIYAQTSGYLKSWSFDTPALG